MRISTNQIYDTGIQGMMRNQARLDKLQNQISSDTKILTAADDPVGAAQVLAVSQSKAVEEQYQTNQSSAKSQLSLLDLQLSSLTTALQTVRDNIVKGGNGSYTPADRESVAKDLESNLAEILGIANTDNGIGDYLFSGYQGGTRPFAADGLAAKSPATESSIAYSGDGGNRALQVSASRKMAVSVAGSEVFMNGKNGNGTFVATTGGNVGVSASTANTGTATADAGAVTDRAKWAAALTDSTAGRPLEIRFTDATHYGIYDPVSNLTTGPLTYTSGAAIPLVTASAPAVDFGAQVVISGTPVAGDSFSVQPGINQGSGIIDMGSVLDTQKWSAAVNNTLAGKPVEIRFSANATTGKIEYSIYDPVGGLKTPAQPFTVGQAIPLVTKNGVDFGSQVVVTGTPKVGDSFTVTPSTSQSIFQTVQNMIGILRSPLPSSTYSATQLANDLAGQLSNIDQAMSQVSDVLSTVGANERELDALGSTSSDLVIQYTATISDIQGLDYNQTYSDYTRQMVNLEAAQKSFVKIAGLSLFDYI